MNEWIESCYKRAKYILRTVLSKTTVVAGTDSPFWYRFVERPNNGFFPHKKRRHTFLSSTALAFYQLRIQYNIKLRQAVASSLHVPYIFPKKEFYLILGREPWGHLYHLSYKKLSTHHPNTKKMTQIPSHQPLLVLPLLPVGLVFQAVQLGKQLRHLLAVAIMGLGEIRIWGLSPEFVLFLQQQTRRVQGLYFWKLMRTMFPVLQSRTRTHMEKAAIRMDL